MPESIITSIEYKSVLLSCLPERLKKAGVRNVMIEHGGVRFSCDGSRLPAAAEAVAKHIIFDIKPFELLRLLRLLPAELRDPLPIIPRAMELTANNEPVGAAAADVLELLERETRINIEGALRFRLGYVTERWAMALDRAGEELLLDRELDTLIQLAGRKGETNESPLRELKMVLYGDESVTMDLPSGGRLECDSADGESLIGIASSLAPDIVSIYDLSGGRSMSFIGKAVAVFGERVCLFFACD